MLECYANLGKKALAETARDAGNEQGGKPIKAASNKGARAIA